MERKIYALMLLIMAWANKYIKSKIGEISGVIRNFMEEAGVILSMSFRLLVVVSCLFFSVAEVEAQLCSGGVRFEKPGCLENPVVDKGIFQIYPGRPDQTQPGCNSNLGELSGHQYYVSDGIYSQFGDVENAKLPSDDDSKSYLLYKPSTTNSILTVRVHKLPGNPTNQVFVSFRFFYGNVKGDPASPVTGTYIKTNSSNGNYDFYITKDDCPEQVHQVSSGSSGGLDLGTSFCGDKYGWYTMRALITLPEYLDNNFLDIWLEMNFYNQPAGDVIFLDNVLVSYNGTICVEKSMACPGDVLSLTDEVYPYGTAISWQYRYPDNSDQWFDVADPSAGFTFNPDGDFDKQNLQFRAEVTLLDGSKSMTDILEVTTDPKCKPQVSVSPSVACAGDDVNLKTKYYPANSEITWEYRYPGSSDWATIPSGSFISSSGGETSTPFTYNPPQGVSSAEFCAKAKLQDGTEIPVSDVVVVKTTTSCPIYVCEIEDIELGRNDLDDWGYEYYDLNGNRLFNHHNGSLNSNKDNNSVRNLVFEQIENNGGIVIKAKVRNSGEQLTYNFFKKDKCEKLEVTPELLCSGDAITLMAENYPIGSTVTWQYSYEGSSWEAVPNGSFTMNSDKVTIPFTYQPPQGAKKVQFQATVKRPDGTEKTKSFEVATDPACPVYACEIDEIVLNSDESLQNFEYYDLNGRRLFEQYNGMQGLNSYWNNTLVKELVYNQVIEGGGVKIKAWTQNNGKQLTFNIVKGDKCETLEVTPELLCSGDAITLMAENYPIGSTVTWQYSYEDSSWETVPNGSFTMNSDKVTIPFTYQPPQGAKKVQFQATVKRPDGTEKTKSFEVATDPACPVYVCEIDEIVITENGLYNWEYYDLNNNRLFNGANGDLNGNYYESSINSNVNIRDAVYEKIMNNGGVVIKAEKHPNKYTFTFKKGKNCESLEVLGDEPITICEGETPTVTYQLKGSAGTYNYVAKLYDKNNVEVKSITGTWTTTADPADVSLNLPGNISFGEYSLKLSVNDQEFDAVTRTVTVKELPKVVVSSDPICAGTSDAPIATMTPSDGMTFEWVNTPTWSSLTAGTHTVSYKITSDNGCFVEGTTDVTVEAPIIFELAKAGPICKSESVDLKVEGTVSGVVANIDAYQWFEGGVAIPGATGATYTASPESTTEYSLTIKGNKCEAATKSVKVEVEEPIVFELAKVDAICEGESVELKVDGTVTGTLAENNAYQWYKGGVAIPSATGATYTASPESTTEYSLTIKGNKCEATTRSVEVEVEEPIDFTLAEVDAICEGESVELKVDGAVTGTLAENNAYQWYKRGVAIPSATGATYTASPESTTEYSLTIKGNKCETTTKSVKVEVEEPIDFTLAKVDAICEGESVELKVDGAVTGTLAENNAYQWYKGSELIEGATSPSYELQNATVTATADYTLTVSGKKCKSVSKTVSVVVKELPDADLTAEPICQGLTVAPKVPGNWISGWNYGWINEPAWETLSVGVHKQKYVVTAPNGCSAEGEMDVTVEEPIQITMPKVETLCVGAFVELTPTSVTGTLANNPYSWKGGGQTGVEKTFRVEKLCETITCILTVKGNACPEKSEMVQVPVVRPELKEPWPANKEDQEVCFSDGDFSPIKSEAEIKALYGPDCNTVKVTFTEDKKEDDCGWYKKRTYVVTDACQHNVSPANAVIKVSGGDKSAPVYVSEKIWPEDIKNVNECYSVALADRLADNATIAALYSDCGGVTVTHEDDAKDGCEWSIVRTYTIKDACGNTVTPSPTQTLSGGDKTAPTLSGSLAPLEEVGCSKENAPKAYTTIAELAAAGLTISDNCSADFTISSEDVETSSNCSTVVTRTYTIADACENKATAEQTITVKRDDFEMPENGAATVQCASEAKAAGEEGSKITLPVVKDACENVLTPVGEPVVSETPACDGEVTYTYTYKDCANHAHDWKFVYTIAKPTMTFSGTIADVEDVDACYSEEQKNKLLTAEAVKAMYTSSCNREITVTPTDNIESDSDCGWKITRTYTISDGGCNTDTKTMSVSGSDKTAPTLSGSLAPLEEEGCSKENAPAAYTSIAELTAAGLTVSDNCSTDFTISSEDVETSSNCSTVVTRTYTIADACENKATAEQTITIKRADFTMSKDDGTTIACASELKEPTLPVVEDACGNKLTGELKAGYPTATPACDGTVTYVYTFTDCTGKSKDWTYTYTISKPVITMPEDGKHPVSCVVDAVAPTAPEVKDNCGRKLTVTQNGKAVKNVGTDGNGTVTYNFTYTDCAGATYPWKYVYEVKANAFTPEPDGTSTVKCVTEATAPTLPTITVCGQNVTLTQQTTSPEDKTHEGCGEIIFRYDYIVNGTPYVWSYTYTVTPEDFTMTDNGKETIACASELKEPTLPVVEDACGNKLTGVLKSVTPAAVPTCDGTVTYVYTFTDCANHAHDWEFVYTIEKPKLTIPSDGGSDVACLKDVKDPTAEALTDNCGRTVTAVANGERVVNIGTDGNGTVTYNFTYTDCSGSTYPWKYVYNVKADAFTPETDGASTVNCVKEAVAPTMPTITVCGQDVVLTAQANSPVDNTVNGCGTYIYSYDYEVNGQSYVWKYTYTVSPQDFTPPTAGEATVDCPIKVVAPSLPDVEDACGNKLKGVLKEGYPTEKPDCEGTVTYVYTFTDCASHAHDWEFVYTIEKPTMTFSGSIVDVEGVDACYTDEHKNLLLTAEAVKSMYTTSCNRTISVTPTDKIESNSDCGWKITRTYTISDGGCNTDTKTMSVSGSDKTVPELTGTWPKDIVDQDNCVANADITGLMSDNDVKALYKDCSSFEVSHADATTGDDCGWTVTRTYTIKDKCNNATTKTMSVSGSDKTAPALVGTWPKDIIDQDNCVANADITGLMSDDDVKALYKDCGTFDVTHADATTGDDCGWTVTRTYTIKDKCSNATTKTMSVSGSDKTAPELTGTRPEDISGQNTCFANADLSGLKDVDYIKGIYSDVCGDVNVTYSEEKNETDCGWSVKRTYLISDFCKNSVSTSVTVSGKDAEKPIITTTAVSGDKGCNPTIVAPTFTVTDNCDNNVQVQVTTTGVQGAGYKKTQTWTATAKDVCGNSAEPVVIVYTWIEDSSTPFAVQMPADMVICQGSSVKLIPTIQGDPTSFSWKQGGTEVSTDETYTATPNETTTYHFTAVANECISSSGSVTITVEDPISFDLNEKDLVICEGTSVSLEPINIQGDLAQAPYSWTKNGVVVSSAAKLIDTPSANATYELTISGNKCAKARKSVSVTVEKQPSVHLRLSDNEVCEDENVTLQVTYSNVLGLEWLSKEEGNSEFTVFANNLSATNEVVATNDIMYQVRSTGNQACPAVVSDAVALTVEPKMEISLPSEIAICSKDEKTIEAAFSRTPTSIVWMVKNANAANYHQTKFTEAKIVVNPNVSSYYKVIASSKNCPTAEAEVLLKVEEIPNWEIISQTNNVCEGDEVELSTDLPSDYNFVWEAKTHGSANYERLPESTSKLYDSPMESTTYRLSVQSPAGCSAGSKLYDVKVDKPVYGSIADIAICDGDSGRLSVFVDDKSSYSYYWSDMPDYSNILSRQTSVRVAPKTTTSYYLKIVNGVCTTEYEAEVEVRTLPEIVGIEDMGNRMYRIQVEGGSVPYSYTWGKNSMPTSSDIMERPTYGMTYNVTVTDAIGCKVSDVVEVPTYELEIPEYFFPEFEKWKVKNLDRFYGSKVTIYDRFGKMLKEYDVDQFKGWDGTYLGSPMPSTDYWYVISIQELDKELVGHFTLRRRNK